MINKDTIRDMVNFFFENKLKVHVEEISGNWHNGLITEVKDNFFVVDEVVKGLSPVAFSAVIKIEKYKER